MEWYHVRRDWDLSKGVSVKKRLNGFVVLFIFIIAASLCGAGSCAILRRYRPVYIASAAIQVNAPGEPDRMSFTDQQIEQDMLYNYRKMKASRITSIGLLQELLNKDVVRATKWYSSLGNNRTTNLYGSFESNYHKGLKNLERNLSVVAPKDSFLVIVSMRGPSPEEMALIANEMAMLFIRRESDNYNRDIRERIAEARKYQQKIRSKVNVASNEMRHIRAGTPYGGLDTDIGSSSANQGLLISLASLDKLQLEVAGLTAELAIQRKNAKSVSDQNTSNEDVIEDPEPAGATTNHSAKSSDISVNDRLAIATAQLEAQKTKVESLRKELREYGRVRAAYLEAEARRDTIMVSAEEFNSYVEKLVRLLEDPKVSGVSLAFLAVPPLEISWPKVELWIPSAGGIGLVLGLIVLLLRKIGKKV